MMQIVIGPLRQIYLVQQLIKRERSDFRRLWIEIFKNIFKMETSLTFCNENSHHSWLSAMRCKQMVIHYHHHETKLETELVSVTPTMFPSCSYPWGTQIRFNADKLHLLRHYDAYYDSIQCLKCQLSPSRRFELQFHLQYPTFTLFRSRHVQTSNGWAYIHMQHHHSISISKLMELRFSTVQILVHSESAHRLKHNCIQT